MVFPSKTVSKLYLDLDAGLAPINVFFRWLPLPTFINRDRANVKMTNLFKSIMKQRRQDNDTASKDLLNTLMQSNYRSGQTLSDDVIAHIMIATLMGGQHTSSTTSSWVFFELSRRPDIVYIILIKQATKRRAVNGSHRKT
jgi:sterol 14-demethylase